MDSLWIQNYNSEIDTYVAFRGIFDLKNPEVVDFKFCGAQNYLIWIDGDFLTEGPRRFSLIEPVFDNHKIHLSPGRHIIASIVHCAAVVTAAFDGSSVPPFFQCGVTSGARKIDVHWKCLQFEGFKPMVRRRSKVLTWVEWCNTAKNPFGWQNIEFDDSSWQTSVSAKVDISPIDCKTGQIKHFNYPIKPVATGRFAEVFGYEFDDIAVRLFLRDLVCQNLPADGIWFRYDLGRAMLGRPEFTIELPEGAELDLIYNESLTNGRVSPFIPFSAGPSCNSDHYIAHGGTQTFYPLSVRGGRFIEIHIKAPAESVKIIDAIFIESRYYEHDYGNFQTNDTLLNKIWKVGVDTLHACSADIVTDTPVREIGQWTGDSLVVGMEIAANVFNDLRPFARTIRQAATCAKQDGLISALPCGRPTFLPAYSLLWVDANIRYYELTGDDCLLKEMYQPAIKNMSVFEKSWDDRSGLPFNIDFDYIDWGFILNSHLKNITLTQYYARTLKNMFRWCQVLNVPQAQHYYDLLKKVEIFLFDFLSHTLIDTKGDWSKLGFHIVSMYLILDLLSPIQKKQAIEYLINYINNCFPNSPKGDRLAHPHIKSGKYITPYFMHFVFPALIENGKADFVLEKYKICWGWALEQGLTTWPEVFDTRWSHSHHWSGCPTWQMSKYFLGLNPRKDIGKNSFELTFTPSSLPAASGEIPLNYNYDKNTVKIEWKTDGNNIEYQINSPEPIYLTQLKNNETIKIEMKTKLLLERSGDIFSIKRVESSIR